MSKASPPELKKFMDKKTSLLIFGKVAELAGSFGTAISCGTWFLTIFSRRQLLLKNSLWDLLLFAETMFHRWKHSRLFDCSYPSYSSEKS